MSKDPFDELFGPTASAAEEPKPVPARERLAYEQAERVKTLPLPMTKPDTPGKGKPTDSAKSEPAVGGANGSSSRAKPWIIVGLITVLALVASIIVLNLARAGDDPSPTAAPTEQTTSKPQSTSKPATSDDDAGAGDAPEANKVPSVEVGSTSTLDIPAWGVTAQFSGKFGAISYTIPNGQTLILESSLISSLPQSCAAMRQQWGVTKEGDGSFAVAKPDHSCTAAPELFDEIWGLTDALVQSISPA